MKKKRRAVLLLMYQFQNRLSSSEVSYLFVRSTEQLYRSSKVKIQECFTLLGFTPKWQ